MAMDTFHFPIPSLSLIFLMFNEEGNVGRVLDEALDYCRAHLPDWEILVVDDGSSDGGPDIVRAMAVQEPRIRLYQRPANGGMGAGMRDGVAQAAKDYFVFLPADGQIDPHELGRMVPLLGGGDIVLSIYPHRHSTLQRAVMSRVFRDYLLVMADIRFQLEGLYLYPTAPARRYMPLIPANTFFLSFELIQRGVEDGLRTVMTTIDVRPRQTGSSKVTRPGAMWRVIREVADYRRRRMLGR
jgi:dolichol-phosphate mannosyltransferase